MPFSTSLTSADLNDFIAPSQACVVTLNGSKLATTTDGSDEAGLVQPNGRAKVAGAARGFRQTVLQPALGTDQAQHAQAVKVTLNDCLACSGCVTSAETVLLEHQSSEELLSKLADPLTTVVVSLSPQSVTALAAAVGLAAIDCAGRLITALRQLGVRAVFDIAWSRDVALLETAAEFLDRFCSSQRGKEALQHAAKAAAAGSEGPEGMELDSASGSAAQQQLQQAAHAGQAGPLPMLASACPGWVCYAEKTHGSYVLPYISTTKSPQAVMGTLVKQQWAQSQKLQPGSIYHCAIMPCYDKKLEAARDDFSTSDQSSSSTSAGSTVAETDCVLATSELWELLQQRGLDITALPPSAFDQPFSNMAAAAGRAAGHGVAGGSGGYLEQVMREAAAALGQRLPPGRLAMVAGRNPDLKEWTLEVGGRPVLRGATAYGFRNIQGLMRKIKLGRCEYDYVEVMACPSGCLNGGGQLRPSPAQSPAQLIDQLEVLYHDEDSLVERPPGDNPGVQELYQRWVGGAPGSAPAHSLLHTQYHKREKSVTATLGDW